jgi:putative redox protein
MKRSKIKIENSKGHLLNAFLELPANQKPDEYAIFAHCFTCSSSLVAVRNISRQLTAHGFGVLRFDFTGLGLSEGEFIDSHFSANVQDLLDVHDYMGKNYKSPVLLIGHSLGGAAVICAGKEIEEVQAVATIGAPADVSHVKKHFSHAIAEIEEKGEVQADIGGRPFTINREFVEHFEKTDLPNVVSLLKKPLLIMHSPFDKIVGIENAEKLYRHAYHPKSFVSLDKADHLLMKEEDSLYAGEVIGAWVKRYFDRRQVANLDTAGEQMVAHLDMEEYKYTTKIQLNKHHLIADEPESIGGDDFGPSPYELLISALGACTTMTLKMYARRKKWNLQEVFVYISHEKTEPRTEDRDSKLKPDLFKLKFRFIGDLNDDQKERLLEIAGKCPVHRSLKSINYFESSMIDQVL